MFGIVSRFLQFFRPGGSKDGEDRAVYLVTAPNEPIAQMWQDILKQKGITAMLKGESGSVGQPYASSLALHCELHVRESQLSRARTVLRPYVEGK